MTFILGGMPNSSSISSFARDHRTPKVAATPVVKSNGRVPTEAAGHNDADAEIAGELASALAGIAEKNEPALARLYDATVNRVYAVALRITRTPEAAEEIVSDVYMQVWRDVSRYDKSRGSVLAWLLIIARSRALDLLRRKDEAFSHPDPYELVDDASFAIGGPYDWLAQSRSNLALHEAIKQLTPLQRQILALAFFRGFSHVEIEQHTGMALGTIKTCIRRTLAKLRESLGDDAVNHF